MYDRPMSAFVPHLSQNRLVASRSTPVLQQAFATNAQQRLSQTNLSRLNVPLPAPVSTLTGAQGILRTPNMRAPLSHNTIVSALSARRRHGDQHKQSGSDLSEVTMGEADQSATPTKPARRSRSNSKNWPSGQGFDRLMSSSSSISDASDTGKTTRYDDKHLTRAWDNLWSSHINTPPNYARRHIVMTKVYKNCMTAMGNYVSNSQDHTLERDLRKLYADCLNTYKGTTHYSESEALKSLEIDLFHTLHNLRFNIFLGDSVWNSAMSDSATLLKTSETETLQKIASAPDHSTLDAVIQQWFDGSVDFDKSFKIPSYEKARQNIRDNIKEMLFPENTDSTLTDPDPMHADSQGSLAERKDFLKVCVISFYDSLTCDPSEAQHPSLRKWQNSVLPELHGTFLDLQTQPDLKKYAQCLKKFMGIDQKGAQILGLNLKDLNADHPKSESVSIFQQAITAPPTGESR